MSILPNFDDRVMVTLAFGHRKYAQMALGLGRSLRLIGDPTPRMVITDLDGYPWEKSFDIVVKRSIPPSELWWAKTLAFEHCSARRALFIDGDSLAFRRLAPIYDAFEGAVFGIQGVPMREGTWYGKDIADLCCVAGVDSIIKLNGGMLYYERGPEFEEFMREVRRIAAETPKYGWHLSRGVPPDEICIGLAMSRTGLGRCLPEEINFSNSAFGLVGKLRLDVFSNRCDYLCRRHTLQHVSPYIFHASFHKNFLNYWIQLRKLQYLEDYEASHPWGYYSRATKWRRTVERRILRLVLGFKV